MGLLSEATDNIAVHKHSSKHRAEIETSELCDCFYRLSISLPSQISSWCDNGQMAICECWVYLVIGSASNYHIPTELLLLVRNFRFPDINFPTS